VEEEKMSQQESTPSQAVVDLFVNSSHGDFPKVKELLGLHPNILNLVSSAQETALGAAAHTGQKAIALQANSFGLVVGVQKDKAPSYHTLRDLKGMKIGVTGPGSASAIGLKMLLSKVGMTVDDVGVIGVGAGAAAVAAVITGKLDAIANFDPAISLLERDGAIKTILDTRHAKDLDYLYGGPFAASAFYLDARFSERYPKTTQAFVNAISTALDWMTKASTDEIVETVPPEYYAGDRALYRVMIEQNRERVSPDGRISPEAAEIVLRNLSAFEDTLRNVKIDLAGTYDNSFIERAPKLRAP